jgi:hypothetical protein
MLTWWLVLAKLVHGGIFDPGLEEQLRDLSAITPSMFIIKHKNDRDFMEFVWLFAVPVSRTKAEARELLKTCGKNLFQADLSNDIVWALVKLMDNGKMGQGNCWKKEGNGGAPVHCGWKGRFVGSNDKGVELYKTLRGCLWAIKVDHWEKSWQEYWARLKADAPAEAVAGAAGGVDEEDCEVECLPMESSDIVYEEV